MAFSQSILVALFCMAVVFVTLTALWGVIRLFTVVLGAVEKRGRNAQS